MLKQLILIADEDEELRKQLELALRQAGFRTFGTSSAKEALRFVEKYLPDLLLTEVRLPDGSGLELFRYAQQAHLALGGILITGQGSLRKIMKALEVGFDYSLLKPFTPKELEEAIQTTIDRTLLEREMQRRFLLNSLHSVTRHLTEPYDLIGFSRMLVETIALETHSDYCAIFLPETPEQKDKLQIAANYISDAGRQDFTAKTFPAPRLAARVVQQARSLSLKRASGVEQNDGEGEFIPGAVIAVPLLLNKQTLGALIAAKASPDERYEGGMRQLLEIYATQFASLLENQLLKITIDKTASSEKEHGESTNGVAEIVAIADSDSVELNGEGDNNGSNGYHETSGQLEPVITTSFKGMFGLEERRMSLLAGKIANRQQSEKHDLAIKLQKDTIGALEAAREQLQNHLQKVRPPSADLLKAEEGLHSLIDDIRKLSYELHPSMLDEYGLVAALRQYLQAVTDQNFRPTIRTEGEDLPRLDAKVELALFLSSQDALDLTRRAGDSNHVVIVVHVSGMRGTSQILELQIKSKIQLYDIDVTDASTDEVWCDILVLKERVKLVGVSCDVKNHSVQGTQLYFRYAIPSLVKP